MPNLTAEERAREIVLAHPWSEQSLFSLISEALTAARLSGIEEAATNCEGNATKLRELASKLEANGERVLAEYTGIRAEQTEGIAKAIRSLSSKEHID